MLKPIGIVVDPEVPQEEINRRCQANAEVITLYQRNVDGQLDDAQKKLLGGVAVELYRPVLRGASFIGYTTFVAGNTFLHECIGDVVSVLLHDEAAKDLSVDMMTIYAAPFTNVKGTIETGDHKQLRPTILESKKQKTFVPAMETSDVSCLIRQGLPMRSSSSSVAWSKTSKSRPTS